MASSISARVVRSSAKVRSWLTDLRMRSVSMRRSSIPSARSCIAREFTPKMLRKSSTFAFARSPSVRMPMLSRRFALCLPMPGMTRTFMGARKAASLPGYTTVSPFGLSRSEAIFGDRLAARDADGAGDAQFGDMLLDARGDGHGVVAREASGRHVEKRLVNRDLLE